MIRIKRLIGASTLGLLVSLGTGPVVQAGFGEGVTAYETGNYAAAFEEWLPLAKANDPAAMRNVGHLYRRGLGVDQDYKKAFTWYMRAATLGFDRAQANVAGMYLAGEGVSRDYGLAANWFAKAAQQGHVLSQYQLGLMFENGVGVQKSDAAALGWYRLAAKAGYPEALDKVSQLTAERDNPDTIEAKPEIAAAEDTVKTPTKAASTASASAPAASTASTARAATPTEMSAAPDTSKTSATAPTKKPQSIQKKGFYDALKSLVVTSTANSGKPDAATVDSGEAATSENEATTSLQKSQSQKQAATTPSAQATTPSKAGSKSTDPVKVASVPTPVQSVKASGGDAGLTTAERLEMADLSYTLKEYQQSLAIWAKLATEGNAEAQYRLGMLFDNGLAVPLDRVRAHYWWEKAKDNGSSEAALALASLEKSLTYVEKRQIDRTD